MRMTATAPDVKPTGWYNTSDTVRLLGMARNTFWRKKRAGKIKGVLRKVDNTFWYQGREILRFFNASYDDKPSGSRRCKA